MTNKAMARLLKQKDENYKKGTIQIMTLLCIEHQLIHHIAWQHGNTSFQSTNVTSIK